MSKTSYVWDSNALVPTEITIPLKKHRSNDEPEDITFYELSKTELETFITQAMSREMGVEVEVDNMDFDESIPESDKNPKKVKIWQIRPMAEIGAESMDILCETLAVACGTKTKQWFLDLNLPLSKYALLLDMLYKINHVAEIMASRGNYLTLPGLMGLVEEETKSPAQTSQE